MITVKIEISAETHKILEEMFEKPISEIRNNEEIEIEKSNVKMVLEEYSPSESFGLTESIVISLSFVSAVFAPFVTEWLRTKIRKTNEIISIKIDGKHVNKNDIELVLTEKTQSDNEGEHESNK